MMVVYFNFGCDCEMSLPTAVSGALWVEAKTREGQLYRGRYNTISHCGVVKVYGPQSVHSRTEGM